MDLAEGFRSLPVVTRTYVSLCLVTTAACALDLVTPFHIYFNARLIFQKREYWRLATNFLYFGDLGLDFLFHMFFLVKYCKSLEEGSFRGRPADFAWMLLLGAAMITALALTPLGRVQFLGSSLAFMLVYVWGRRHPRLSLSFLGAFTFPAPYLPWVLLAFSAVLGASPVGDALGMAAGHAYYYLEDVYPHLSGGRRLLRTPAVVAALFPPEGGGAAARAAAAVAGAGGGGFRVFAPGEPPDARAD